MSVIIQFTPIIYLLVHSRIHLRLPLSPNPYADDMETAKKLVEHAYKAVGIK
jgi:CRISPR/Cas system CMR subunit Cmr6 (Cas7 group RAMP superfamily)